MATVGDPESQYNREDFHAFTEKRAPQGEGAKQKETLQKQFKHTHKRFIMSQDNFLTHSIHRVHAIHEFLLDLDKYNEPHYKKHDYEKGERSFLMAERIAFSSNKGLGSADCLPFLHVSAETGYAPSQFVLGLIYKFGINVKKKWFKSFVLIRKAAEQGQVDAQVFLGEMYREEKRVKDLRKSFWWLNEAAKKGDARAQYVLGFLYYIGKSIEKNHKKSFEWYSKSAEQGVEEAQYMLGLAYEHGEGVEVNIKKAFENYTQSANKGFVPALYSLGKLYQQRAIEGIYNYTKKSEICKYDEYNQEISGNLRFASNFYSDAIDNGFCGYNNGYDAMKKSQRLLSFVNKIDETIYKNTSYQRDRLAIVSVIIRIAKHFFPDRKYENKIIIEDVIEDVKEKRREENNYIYPAGKMWNGYPYEFFLVSKELKMKNNYTCQDCGVCLIIRGGRKREGHRRYLHAHHINGDKKDNREINLRILCVECHFNGYHSRREGDVENEDIKICRKIKKIQSILFPPYNHFYFEKGEAFYLQKKYNEAFPLIKATAAQGYANAQFILACMYHYGRGVKEDKTESTKWCRRAAKQGHMLAQYTLGMKYYYGKNIRKNYSSAARWFEKAAEQGHVDSQLLIANMYEMGKGVQKDNKEAFEWYSESSGDSR